MLFAQITDTHISLNNLSSSGRRADKQLKNIINHINTLPIPPSFVLLTGDCVHQGTKSEYTQLQQLLAQFEMPCFIIPGNHDDRLLLRETFPHINSLCQNDIFIQYTIEEYPFRLIGMDTIRQNAPEGELCSIRLSWLNKILTQAPDKPTILFMHHPPVKCGIAILDNMLNQNADELAQILVSHPQVKHILCGHFHRALQSLWNGISVSIAGSTVAQISPDFHPLSGLKWSTEPPAYSLHRWDSVGLTTQFCSIPVVE